MPCDLISFCSDGGNARAGNYRALDGRHVAIGGHGRIDQDLEKVGRAAIAGRAIGFGFGLQSLGWLGN